jgi:predicted metal-dependent hydrolase
MKKSARMAALVEALPLEAGLAPDPCYQGYFRLFNAEEYYEAHDVLEHLWLANGRLDRNFAFYKGLIQVAGAFVHLQKQSARPGHAKDGRRLRPATRLFGLAVANLAGYGPRHLGLDVDALCALCAEYAAAIAAADFTRNPWNAGNGPRLALGAL